MRTSVLIACGALLSCTKSTEPTNSGVNVAASISAVSLADDCSTNAEPDEAAADAGAADFAPCASDAPCPGFCQQSSVQIDFTVGAGSEGPLAFEILEARLLDADTMQVVDDLDTRDPTIWLDEMYVEWNEQLGSPSDENASYKLTAPDWSDIFNWEGDADREAGGPEFILELDVDIDGSLRTLRSEPVSKEPEIVT